MPTFNMGDMLNCCRGWHDFSDGATECHVCGLASNEASVPSADTLAADKAKVLASFPDADEDDREPCRECGAVPGTPEYGTVGDGFDGLSPSCADKAEPKEYPVRLWATLRGVAETTIEARNHDEAVEKARALKHSEFRFDPADGYDIEGDETIHVDWPYDEDEGDDPVEIDKRKDGEPFSWVACEIVKELAALYGNPDYEDAVHDLISRAKVACSKES
jgi:hypothetical protein